MAGAIEDLLEPGEKIVCRSSPWSLDGLKRWLMCALLLLALLIVLQGVFPSSFRSFLTNLVQLGFLGLIFAFVLLLFGDAVLTDCRLIRRWGVLRRKREELTLDEIRIVEGLEIDTIRPVRVFSGSGRFIEIHFPNARRMGRAVARAAGLQIPTGFAPIGERAWNVLYHAGSLGAVAGFVWLSGGWSPVPVSSKLVPPLPFSCRGWSRPQFSAFSAEDFSGCLSVLPI